MPDIAFEAGKHAFRARLNDKTPNICKQLLSHLPVETFAVHAKFAGEEIITMVPFFAEPENEVLGVTAGDIGYYPGRQTLCLFYGEVTPFGPVSVFASLVPPFDSVRATALEILQSGSLPVSIRVEDSDHGSDLVADLPGTTSEGHVPAFVSEYWQRAWLTTPEDILRLRQTRRPPSGNMPCVVYACFDLFWLGEELQVLRKLLLQQVDQDSAQASRWQTATALFRHHAMRLEKFEMIDTSSFLRQLADLFSSGAQNTKVCLSVLETSWIALNRMQSCVDALIAWNTLDQYRRDVEQNLPAGKVPY